MSPKDSMENVRRAAERILQGGVVVFPTETFYALGAHCMCRSALGRIYRIKARAHGAPLLCIVDGPGRLADLVEQIPAEVEELIKKFWPGPLTLVLRATKGLPEALTGRGKGVGVRWSPNALAQALVKEVGAPVVGTSANLSGKPPATFLEEIPELILRSVDGVLDGGRLSGGLASTVLDCTVSPFKILRAGAVSREELMEVVPLSPDFSETAHKRD